MAGREHLLGGDGDVGDYLMAGQETELERLRQQSLVLEPAGRRLLSELGAGDGKRALDVGCGVLGWLRILGQWVGHGSVIGTDIDERMLARAGQFAAAEGLGNVTLIADDLFSSTLKPHSFDLVHARFQLTPLGRFDEQIDAYLRLLAPGGVLVLEDADTGTWHYNDPAPAAEELITLITEAFRRSGGDWNAGRRTRGLLRQRGLNPQVRAEVAVLDPRHPYLRAPLQFAASLRPRLLALVEQERLDELCAQAEAELADPERWGTMFTLVQTWTAVQA
jgi:SAM-dependent methyltransferase